MKFTTTSSSSSSSSSSSTMPDATTVTAPEGQSLNPRNLKPCCACPITKSARDDCFIKFDGDEAPTKCADLIEQHKACMRGYGFKI